MNIHKPSFFRDSNVFSNVEGYEQFYSLDALLNLLTIFSVLDFNGSGSQTD